MNKNLVLSISMSLQYAFFLIATVAVLTYQFISSIYCIIVAIIGYVVAFAIASITSIFNLIDLLVASKKVSQEDTSLVASANKEVLHSKKEVWQSVFSAVIWTLLFIFSLVVLITYFSKIQMM